MGSTGGGGERILTAGMGSSCTKSHWSSIKRKKRLVSTIVQGGKRKGLERRGECRKGFIRGGRSEEGGENFGARVNRTGIALEMGFSDN